MISATITPIPSSTSSIAATITPLPANLSTAEGTTNTPPTGSPRIVTKYQGTHIEHTSREDIQQRAQAVWNQILTLRPEIDSSTLQVNFSHVYVKYRTKEGKRDWIHKNIEDATLQALFKEIREIGKELHQSTRPPVDSKPELRGPTTPLQIAGSNWPDIRPKTSLAFRTETPHLAALLRNKTDTEKKVIHTNLAALETFIQTFQKGLIKLKTSREEELREVDLGKEQRKQLQQEIKQLSFFVQTNLDWFALSWAISMNPKSILENPNYLPKEEEARAQSARIQNTLLSSSQLTQNKPSFLQRWSTKQPPSSLKEHTTFVKYYAQEIPELFIFPPIEALTQRENEGDSGPLPKPPLEQFFLQALNRKIPAPYTDDLLIKWIFPDASEDVLQDLVALMHAARSNADSVMFKQSSPTS